jgi:hypothetical protein
VAPETRWSSWPNWSRASEHLEAAPHRRAAAPPPRGPPAAHWVGPPRGGPPSTPVLGPAGEPGSPGLPLVGLPHQRRVNSSPPVRSNTPPTLNEASSLASHAASEAASSGLPIRPSGIFCLCDSMS